MFKESQYRNTGTKNTTQPNNAVNTNSNSTPNLSNLVNPSNWWIKLKQMRDLKNSFMSGFSNPSMWGEIQNLNNMQRGPDFDIDLKRLVSKYGPEVVKYIKNYRF